MLAKDLYVNKRPAYNFRSKTFKKFLYVEWNSDKKIGGGGVLHVLNFVNRLVQFCLKEDQGRTIIFSDRWILNSHQHCASVIPLIDFRSLYRFSSSAGICPSGKEIKVFFDSERKFHDAFSCSEEIAVIRRNGGGFKKVIQNNPKHKMFERNKIGEALRNHNYVFWGDFWVPDPQTKHSPRLFLGENANIQRLAERVIKNLGRNFYVVRLRRGDLAKRYEMVAKSSEPAFVASAIRSRFPVGSKVYIMTDSQNIDYLKPIIDGLKDYSILHRESFPIFKHLWKTNGFELFVCELYLYNKAKRALQNRNEGTRGRFLSLQEIYRSNSLLYTFAQVRPPL